MEAGMLLRPIPLKLPPQNQLHLVNYGLFSARFSVAVKASSLNSQGDYRGPKPKKEWVADWVSKNDDFVRSLPIYVGGLSLLAVLFNRSVSGIAAVADASSSQSRGDLLTLGLAVTNILNGLVWLSIRPKPITPVNPEGVECQNIFSYLPDFVVSELLWRCILQIGYAAVPSSSTNDAAGVDVDKLMQGSLYQSLMKSNSQSYLANLSLYPAKTELPFLPSNTQAVILQPLGIKGIAIIGGNIVRGFTTSDQAWISLVGEKLDATLAKVMNDISVAAKETT